MKTKFLLPILATVLLSGSAQAQYTDNNQTNTINGVASNWVPDGAYIIGQNWVYDTLIIQTGGVLSNTSGYIGYEPGANDNTALVSGSGSVWSNTAGLFVGDYGAGDSLTITNGGTVFNGYGYIGFQLGASNNVVLITGTGSVWTNANDLSVGYSDAGNSLTIGSGGTVYNGNGYIGNTYYASNNTALVAGSGSVWQNAADLSIGYSGAGNSLTITNGGFVYNFGEAYIGYATDFNTVLVTGPFSSSNT